MNEHALSILEDLWHDGHWFMPSKNDVDGAQRLKFLEASRTLVAKGIIERAEHVEHRRTVRTAAKRWKDANGLVCYRGPSSYELHTWKQAYQLTPDGVDLADELSNDPRWDRMRGLS